MKTPASSTACTAGGASVDEEYLLPCAEALLAGTLALMSAYAQGSPTGHGRPLMAAQVVSNLIRLSHHPAFTPTMHTVLNRLCGSWQQQVTGNAPTAPLPQPTALWHDTHPAVQ